MSNLYIAPPEEIREIQWLQLKKQLVYLQQHSPYYKEIFKVHEFDTQRLGTYEDFKSIPLTRKEDLLERNEDFICVEKKEILDFIITSNREGKGAFIGFNQNDLKRLAHSEMEALNFVGVEKDDTVQLAITLDKRREEGMAIYSGLRKIGAAVIRTGNSSPKLQWDSIKQLKPEYIVIDPSFLLVMLDYAGKNNINFKKSSLKAAICVGEPFKNGRNELNTLGNRIREAWDIELFSIFNSAEISTASIECDIHKGHHIQPEFIFAEILDPAGNHVQPGQTGELVITHLQVESMPLLRYATGEMLGFDNTPCACGRNTLRLFTNPVEDIKPAPADSRLSSKHFIELLHDFDGVEAFIIEAREGETDSDIYIVKIADTTTTEDVQVLAGLIESRLRVSPKIEMASVEEIEVLKYPDRKQNAVLFRDYRVK